MDPPPSSSDIVLISIVLDVTPKERVLSPESSSVVFEP